MKQQIVLTLSGLLLLLALFFLGNIDAPKSNSPHTAGQKRFSISDSIQKLKKTLSPSQSLYLNNLEHSVSRGDVKEQFLDNYMLIAAFWKDSVNSFPVYAYYLTQAAKLDNSEKNLTFAARLILDSLRREGNGDIKGWEAETAAVLFEKAIEQDPDNQELRVDLGSTYVYGKGMAGEPAETMKGIQQLLEVVRKDSGNMRAQMVLGIGAVISGQYDKAITRLLKVVSAQSANLEAVSWLADAYAAMGDKKNAVKWYTYSKNLVNNPEFSKEVDERIRTLNTAR